MGSLLSLCPRRDSDDIWVVGAHDDDFNRGPAGCLFTDVGVGGGGKGAAGGGLESVGARAEDEAGGEAASTGGGAATARRGGSAHRPASPSSSTRA